MMETFIVLGLCFILYEALDFFQGCMHSTQPATTDRIESYRRQITEEKLRSLQQTSPDSSASVTPIIGNGGSGNGGGGGNGVETTPPSPKTVRFPSFPETTIDQRYHISSYNPHHQQQQHSVSSSSASLPQHHTLGLQGSNTATASFLPANNTTNFSSLPRDYYYLQQQKHKNTTKFFSKFSSSLSDNRIFPEVVTAPSAVTTAPTFDIIPPTAAAAPLVLDLKRAIFSGKKSSSLQEHRRSGRLSNNNNSGTNEEYLSSNDDDDDIDEDDYSYSSDNDEPVKRIFSISEKF